LTDKTTITVQYRKDETNYHAEWRQTGAGEGDGEHSIYLVQDEDGKRTPEQGEVSQRFPVRIYSQKQIYHLANSPLGLLRIVDDAPEVDKRSWKARWDVEEKRFLSLRAKEREIEASLAEELRLQGELLDLNRRLNLFEQGYYAASLKEFQFRQRQKRAIETWEETWSGMGSRIREIAQEIVPAPLDPKFFDLTRPEDQELIQLADETRKQFEGVRHALTVLAQKVDDAVQSWKRGREESSWKKDVDNAVKNFEDLIKELREKGVGDPSEYGELVQRRQVIEQELKVLASRRNELELIRKQADESLKRLVELRRELTDKRNKFLASVLGNNPYVRIEVVPYGAREEVETKFREIIQAPEPRFANDIGNGHGEGLLAALYANGNEPEMIEKNLLELKRKLREIAKNPDGAKVQDRRFAKHLSNLRPEVFDQLDVWFPEDFLRVKYSVPSDPEEFKPIQEASPGQKTAALLAFLLSYGDEPLIIDQPEDDLDNKLIYRLVVAQVKNLKQQRQVIVVTHNANIVVNGDAEQVIALEAEGGQTQEETGCLQDPDVRDIICEVMEGGREAFRARYRRIVLEEERVRQSRRTA
jgi:DNA repair exonuclease SbcCD ATPase subunit